MSPTPETVIECPSCGKDKCYINQVKGVYYCFRCQASGRVEALGLHRQPGLPAFNIDESATGVSIAPDFHELTPFAQDYLITARGVGWWIIQNLPVFSVPKGILFMFIDWDYWQVRQWEVYGQPKWSDPPMAPSHAKDGVTYTINVNKSDCVVLVEGIGDALKVATAGFNAAALLSSTLHDAQAESLAQTYSQATVMLDADVPIGKVSLTMDLASCHFDEVALGIMYRGDPGGMSVEEIRRILE